METTKNLEGFNPVEINPELIRQYLDSLMKKYSLLADDPFSGKARLALRREIEGMRALLQEREMDSMWSNLNDVFGLSHPRPDTSDSFSPEVQGYKSKFNREDLLN